MGVPDAVGDWPTVSGTTRSPALGPCDGIHIRRLPTTSTLRSARDTASGACVRLWRSGAVVVRACTSDAPTRARMRSQSVISSGSSLDVTMIPSPSRQSESITL